MKSVGEAMAIGRNFTEALQKAMRSLEQKNSAFSWAAPPINDALTVCRTAEERRLHAAMDALRLGHSAEEVAAASGIDLWFVDQLLLLDEIATEIRAADRLAE